MSETTLTSFAHMLMRLSPFQAKQASRARLPGSARGLCPGLGAPCSRSRRVLRPGTHRPAPSETPADRPLAARTPTGAWGSGLDFRSLLKSHLCTPALSHCIHFGQGGTAPTFRGAADHVLVTVTIHQTDTLSSAASLVTFFNPWITLPSNSFIVCSLNYVHSTEVNPVPSVPTVIINSS